MCIWVVDPGSQATNTPVASECLLGGRVGLYNSDASYNVYVFFPHHQAILDTSWVS